MIPIPYQMSGGYLQSLEMSIRYRQPLAKWQVDIGLLLTNVLADVGNPLANYPMDIGNHIANGQRIFAIISQYGPYLLNLYLDLLFSMCRTFFRLSWWITSAAPSPPSLLCWSSFRRCLSHSLTEPSGSTLSSVSLSHDRSMKNHKHCFLE
jgi:hypothetical protein